MSNVDGKQAAISVKDLEVSFGEKRVLDALGFDIPRGAVAGVIGPSGCGKTVAMRSILGLVPFAAGSINILGRNPAELGVNGMRSLRRELGVLFQQGALFSSLSVLENVEAPMREHLNIDPVLMRRAAYAKIDMAGLPRTAGDLRPSELSGGMIKRAALARALALDPKVLFLDEPTAGLDPIGAAAFDDLVLDLRNALDLTVMMITHDLDSLGAICDHIIAMSKGKVLCQGTLAEVRVNDHPWIKEYFGGPRARRLGE
ncbi:ATP-binding cassette domain-containing protein [Mariluticola halotolerans]|nr:ATP-binding cassette domain-containing protein [Mariluticola halotolerans]UJQ94663.1 ATP-binding cassette domain-containing protein [Mariluticola halotolerans]